ncbi:hypothetical protein PIB30_090846 [Stylosanthes scabra]|uniref:Uncharacterized protein n=1 Tax=Stylosanthes scabra TaxID=79078 RepID=A0ABU6RUB6_9FABA|nr:hypothetical protein [Stylosanthes scabra]
MSGRRRGNRRVPPASPTSDGEQPEQVNNFADIAAALRESAAAMRESNAARDREGQHNSNDDDSTAGNRVATLTDFMKLRPSQFSGTTDLSKHYKKIIHLATLFLACVVVAKVPVLNTAVVRAAAWAPPRRRSCIACLFTLLLLFTAPLLCLGFRRATFVACLLRVAATFHGVVAVPEFSITGAACIGVLQRRLTKLLMLCAHLMKQGRCRLKLLKNKREAIARQLRKYVAELVHCGLDETALNLVEQLIEDESLAAAYELLDHYCEKGWSCLCFFLN